MSDFCVVYITAASKEEAAKIGRGIVDEKLGACVQIGGPILSIYEWEGKVCEEEEFRITVKTREELFDGLVEYVKKNHSYSVPQIVAVPVIQGSEEYLQWMTGNLKFEI